MLVILADIHTKTSGSPGDPGMLKIIGCRRPFSGETDEEDHLISG